MAGRIHAGALLALAAIAGPVGARATIGGDARIGGGDSGSRGSSTGIAAAGFAAPRLPPYLQCVPFARQATGVRIYGDAHTWWDQAQGRYDRGSVPRVGAVMAFRAHGASRLGHVAAVSRVVDSRTVLISHANWSPIDGRRGQIERNVKAVDVSPDNDWSRVRVWFAPIKGLGSTAWPLAGFIYNARPGAKPLLKPASKSAPKPGLKPESTAKTATPLRLSGSDPIGAIIAGRRR